jgi:hypothetical protein
MSDDKVRRKNLCWSVRAVYVLEKRLDVSGPGLEEAGRYRMVSELTLAVFTGTCIVVAQAWCAWLVWTQSGHTAWHMRWHWTHGRAQERTFLAWD